MNGQLLEGIETGRGAVHLEKTLHVAFLYSARFFSRVRRGLFRDPESMERSSESVDCIDGRFGGDHNKICLQLPRRVYPSAVELHTWMGPRRKTSKDASGKSERGWKNP